MILICVSVASLSPNDAVIMNTYWSHGRTSYFGQDVDIFIGLQK